MLDADWVLRVARAYGLAWQPDPNAAGVAIRRVTTEEADALAAETAAALTAAIEASARPVAQAPAPAVEGPADEADEPELAVLEVPVPARRIWAGEVIGADDIVWADMPETARSERWVLDADGIIGQSARRALRGRPPSATRFAAPADRRGPGRAGDHGGSAPRR